MAANGSLAVGAFTPTLSVRADGRVGLLYFDLRPDTASASTLLAAAWLSDVAGSRGLYLLALASGLTDVDAISLSSLRLYGQGKLLANQTVLAIAIAFLSNLAFKFGLLSFFGGKALARRAAPSMGAMALGVAGGLLWL